MGEFMSVQLTKAALFVMFCLLLSVNANAQSQRNGFTLEFNRSPANAIAMLEQRGFSEVKIVKRQLLALQVEACRQSVRYSFKLRLDGQIYDDRRIGNCRKQLAEADVLKIAKDSGYKQISIVRIANGYRVNGCRTRRNRQEEFTINFAGDIIDNRVIGTCETRVSFESISADLEKRGYSRIKLLSERRGRYSITACNRRREVELKVGYDGRVSFRKHHWPLPQLHSACREGRRYELEISQYGRIGDPRIIGRCRPVMDNKTLTETLVREGFYGISIKNGRRARFLATACYAKRKYEIDYSSYGDLIGEREAGSCRTMTSAEMIATAKARGATAIRTASESL
ncbi:hypothetical protein GQR58_029451 [Nymphon striatum]|nr:hypothetical protein GQR58_029451 [Nymphon striatum]